MLDAEEVEVSSGAGLVVEEEAEEVVASAVEEEEEEEEGEAGSVCALKAFFK